MFKRPILLIIIILSVSTSPLFAQDSISIRKPNTDKIKLFIKRIFPSQNSSIEPKKLDRKIKGNKPTTKKTKVLKTKNVKKENETISLKTTQPYNPIKIKF